MNSTDIIGWSYEADLHCIPCSRRRFGEWINDRDTVDREGNPIHPVFADDGIDADSGVPHCCGTCHAQLVDDPPFLAKPARPEVVWRSDDGQWCIKRDEVEGLLLCSRNEWGSWRVIGPVGVPLFVRQALRALEEGDAPSHLGGLRI